MPAPPAPGVIALEAIWECNGQVVENTFHYLASGPIDVTVLQGAATEYITWASTRLGLWTLNCALVKIQARDLTSSAGASIIRNVSPPETGTNASPPLPNNVTFAVKRLTGVRGRANRGRVFHFGIGESSITSDGQQVQNTFAAGLVTNYTALLTSQLADQSLTEVILHKATGTHIPVIGYAFSDLFIDSQRRRLPGHNRHH